MPTNLEERFEELRVKEKLVLGTMANLKKKIKWLNSELKSLDEAIEVVQLVSKEVQVTITQSVETIVDAALMDIMDGKYRFRFEFVQRRNKTEVDMWLIDSQGNKTDPMEDNGGGVGLILAFALRVACWRLRAKASDSVFLLDEPMTWVEKDRLSAFGKFIRELYEKLHVQFIIITHEPSLKEFADNVIDFNKL